MITARFRFFSTALTVAALSVSMPALANVKKGLEKWRNGDWDAAVSQFVGPASRGDADASFYLGQAYSLGRGVDKNYSTAVEHYKRASEKGHVAATTNLGITLYKIGRKNEAMTQLRSAAEKGDLRASYVLGVATFVGDGAQRNPALGYGYIVRARDGGFKAASNQAARMATLMTADERVKGEAVAKALATGGSISAALATNSSYVQSSQPSAPVQEQAAVIQPVEKAVVESTQPKPTQQAQPEGWRVQLGAYASQGAARSAWASLVSQSANLLKGHTPIYNQKGNLVRLQVGPIAQRDKAAELCADLSAAGRPCFVTRQ